MRLPRLSTVKLLYGRRFKAKTAVYKSYVMPTILYGCEAWCEGDEHMVKDRDPWREKCMEYSSKIEKGLMT